MKIFISHSWNDKSIATKIYETMQKDGHEVWYDILQLVPGDNIQPKIDVYIKKCDVVVLVWTINAFDSEGVEAEINSAMKLNKRIIPIQADDTPLHHNSQLKGLLSIPFSDFETGMMLLQRGILMLMASETHSKAPWFKEAFGNVVDLGGYLNYVNTYRLEENKNEDGHKTDWADRLEELNKKNEYVRQHLMPSAQDAMAKLQKMMQDLEKGNVPLEELEKMKQTCRENESIHPDLIKKLSEFIDNDIKRLQSGGQPVHSIDFEMIEKAVDRLDKAIAQKKDAAYQDLFSKIKKYGGLFMSDKVIDSIVSGYLKYVTMCPQIMKELLNEAKVSEYVAVKEATYMLVKYLESQDHQLEMKKDNLEGYFDDAYLINNTVQLLIEADLIAKKSISLDYVSKNIVDKYVGLILNRHTKSKLETVLQSIRDLIGLKKHEINWSQVAAIVVGVSAISAGIPYVPNMQGLSGGVGVQNTTNSGGDSPFFEDRMAAMSAKYGGGLNLYGLG